MMKTTTTTRYLLLGILASTLPAASAISLHKRSDGGDPRVLGLDLQRNVIRDPVGHDRNRLRRRDKSVDVDIDNLQTLYFFNASVGTPAQEVRLHLDTGSSDLWINSANSTLCAMTSKPCAASGTYDANSSSTYEYVGSYFNISYVDGSFAAGDYVTDTFKLADTEITDLQFGVGYESTSSQSILGIGYVSNEVQVARSKLKAYNNLPAKMAAEGLIASNAYSLWLNDLSSKTGNILFGGVDRSQYEGDLVTVPVEKSGDSFSEFFITLTGLSLGSTTLDDDMALGVLLDTGSSLTYLPDSITDKIFDTVNAVYEEEEGVAFVPCSLADQTANMTFKFSDPASISVPISELVLDFLDITGRQLSFNNGVAACLFGIAPAGSSTNVLGDTFLRSAYTVFDLENNEISLAQSKFNVSDSEILEIGTGDSAVPSATLVSKPIAAASGLPQGSGGTALSPLNTMTVLMGVSGLLVGFVGFLL